MFRRIRIVVLLYVLLFVAVGSFLARVRARDWDQPLWVEVYPVNGDGSSSAAAAAEHLTGDAFSGIEAFFQSQAAAYGVALERPFRFLIAPALETELPAVPAGGSPIDALFFSLRMRWFVTRLGWASDRPSPDIVLFAIFHDPDRTPVIERSAGLSKGLIAVANVFASPAMHGSNDVIIAHELLHTVGATDKYDPVTNLPYFPIGYADPVREPRLPQARAELMGGRIPLAPNEAVTPRSLAEAVIGAATAVEIGWRKPGT